MPCPWAAMNSRFQSLPSFTASFTLPLLGHITHPLTLVHLTSLEAVHAFPFSAYIAHLAPTPLLMTVATDDVLCPTDLALEAFERALQPKRLLIYPGGHFDGYTGDGFERNSEAMVAFLREYL